MPEVDSSVVVDAPVGFTVDVSNDLERWPRMMADYESVEVLRREGWKTWFRLRHRNGSEWVSWRVIDRDGGFALAERDEPRAPFTFMQHTWLYQGLDDGRTEMTWVMTFELPAEDRPREADCCKYLGTHAAANQQIMKAYIEERYRAAGNGAAPGR